MFSIGQNIVYPMHGAGVVEAIESKEVGGKLSDYYKVRIYAGNINLMIPVDNTAGVRMRELITAEHATAVVGNFATFAGDTDIPWNKRYKYNLDRLKSGEIEQVAGVFYDLINREKTHGLSTSDRKMYILAKNIFCSEVSLALGVSCGEVFDLLMQTVRA